MKECTSWQVAAVSVSSANVSTSSSSSRVAVCRDSNQCSVRPRSVIPGDESPFKDGSGFEPMAAGSRSRKESILMAQ
jgi:hypothetical protein